MSKDEPFDALIKFRCYQILVARTERLAKQAKRPHPDWLRLAMEEYAQTEEKRLKLPPVDEEGKPPNPTPKLSPKKVEQLGPSTRGQRVKRERQRPSEQ